MGSSDHGAIPIDAGASAQSDPIACRTLRFSTDDYPEHQRVEAYREIYGRTIVRHEIAPTGDEPFHFEASLWTLRDFGLALWRMSPCRRSHKGLKHNDSDHFVLGIARSGSGIVEQRGRDAVIGTGEAVLTSSVDPGGVTIGSRSESISLRIPASVLRPKIGDLHNGLAHRIASNTEGLRLLTAYIEAVRNEDALTKPDLCDLVVAHVYDLVLLILGAKGEARQLAQRGGGRAARLAAVLRIIESRSGDPALNAIAAAAALGVTPRYIHLLLEETGRSFTHHLLQRRLEKAAALLRDPRWRERRVADVAAEAGFTDLSYFSRAFRRRYGATPSDVQEAAMRDVLRPA
ncbi:MAG: helix-turn-helix domain-containing protein [Hyphomicrobiales bacterium]|nr:helix-turn-helix domain-containing protein [Hyphomicrobiales bacterium]MBV8825819.1 helix-turn-helix domain-containing protein [Hyphomicrobiales bacterium]